MLGDGLVRCGGRAGETAGRNPGTAPRSDPYYPMKIWVNGHEWAKRQATSAGIGLTELANGFASCDDPAGLQDIGDRFGPGPIRVFCERWWARLALPLTAADRAAGYWWDLSMRQVELSRTIVFTAPRHARTFFETLIADNLDLGRPDNIEIIFGRRIPRQRRSTKRSKRARRPVPDTFKTTIDRANQGVTVNICYKHSRAKQYLKDGRAMRIETVVNDTTDRGVLRRLEHFDELSARALSLRAQPLSGSRTRPSRTGGGPRPYGSATLGSRPWPAPSPTPSPPLSALPTAAFAPRCPPCSAVARTAPPRPATT